jgi:uncharacterized membrane protein
MTQYTSLSISRVSQLTVPRHPKHPAFVHFPITFTLLTGALDALTYFSQNPSTSPLLASAIKTLGIQLDPSTFPVLSYYATILTIITALPTISSGVAELLPVIARDGISSKKAKVGIAHAVINDISILGAAFNWWTRRQNPGLEATGVNMLVSTVLAVPATLGAAYLGAELIYGMGMGVGRGGASVKPVKKVN